jgi:hypothetical protein
MVEVYATSNGFNAHIIKGMLEQQYISAYIMGEYLQGGIGEIPPTGDLVKVCVATEDAEKAVAILKEWESAQ